MCKPVMPGIRSNDEETKSILKFKAISRIVLKLEHDLEKVLKTCVSN